MNFIGFVLRVYVEVYYRVGSFFYLSLKRIYKGNSQPSELEFVDFGFTNGCNDHVNFNGHFCNHYSIKGGKLLRKNVFPTANIISKSNLAGLKRSYSKNMVFRFTRKNYIDMPIQDLWMRFIDSSRIEEGYMYEGLHFAGFISDGFENWCLPHWIWTNASIVNFYFDSGDYERGLFLSELLMKIQDASGGWLVRYDFSSDQVIPLMAPNDSAYIANNAILVAFNHSRDQRFLDCAIKCANWIIETSNPNGLVYFGYDIQQGKWITERNISDIGFTAGFFAKIFEITGKIKYQRFLETFVTKYIELFFNVSKGGFATGIDSQYRQFGGLFARGQAWALEGLIPAYKVLNCEKIRVVIESTINFLVQNQLSNGGWHYNVARPYLGEDCKGVAVIGLSILRWYEITGDRELLIASNRALNWCCLHTRSYGVAAGGIFSFSMEGAIVHHLNSKTAFVYSSAYASILMNKIKSITIADEAI